MTLDQLNVFVAVAEREHLTRAAGALGMTPSAVSASLRALETRYNVQLFHRVGRGIELTREGALFLTFARETVAKATSATNVLVELGGLHVGRIDLHASQTIANYWLPQRILRFIHAYPGVEVSLTIGNTATVSMAVRQGAAELGFIEGTIADGALSILPLATDRLVIVGAATSAGRSKCAADVDHLMRLKWILREPGSGTRDVFENELRSRKIDVENLNVVLVLPSNEAVLSAVQSGDCVTALSESVVAPFVKTGQLTVLDYGLAQREFTVLRHRERRPTAAVRAFEAICRTHFHDLAHL